MPDDPRRIRTPVWRALLYDGGGFESTAARHRLDLGPAHYTNGVFMEPSWLGPKSGGWRCGPLSKQRFRERLDNPSPPLLLGPAVIDQHRPIHVGPQQHQQDRGRVLLVYAFAEWSLSRQRVDDDAIAVTLQSPAQLVEVFNLRVVYERFEDRRKRRDSLKDRGGRVDEDGERSPVVGLFFHRRKPRSFNWADGEMVALHRKLKGGTHYGRLAVEREVHRLDGDPGLGCNVSHLRFSVAASGHQPIGRGHHPLPGGGGPLSAARSWRGRPAGHANSLLEA